MAKWEVAALGLPEDMKAALAGLSSVLDVVSAAANIAKIAVDLARALSGALRDPVAAIAKALQDEIEGLLADLRQAGAYLSGDWGLAQYPYKGLLGGFAAYERRMVARLADRSDPTRPDFSAESSVAAIFLYAAGTPTEVDKPLALLGWLTGLVGTGSKGGGQYPAPSQVVAVPTDPTGQQAPDAIRISWKLAPGVGLPPGGFVVSLSTVGGPITVVATQPNRSPTPPGKNAPRHEVPLADDAGRPVEVYGGADQLANLPAAGEDIYGLLAGGARVKLQDLDQGGGKRRLQRLYRLSSKETLLRWPTGQFFLTVKRGDLPQTPAGQDAASAAGPITYFARVAAVPKEVADGSREWKYDLGAAAQLVKVGSPAKLPISGNLPPSAFGTWSDAAPVAMPGAGGGLQNATEVVAAALAVLALSRPDLPVLSAGTNLGRAFAAVPTGLEAYVGLLALMYPEGYATVVEKAGKDPLAFRVGLYRRCLSVARKMLDQSGMASDALQQVYAAGRDLLRVTITDLLGSARENQSLRACREAGVDKATVLDLLRTEDPAAGDKIRAWLKDGGKGNPPPASVPAGACQSVGAAPNPLSAGIEQPLAAQLESIPGAVRVRAPQILESRSPQSEFPFRPSISAEDAPLAIRAAPGGIREIYERFQQVDGSIQVPKEVASYVTDLLRKQVASASASALPVLAVRPSVLREAAAQGATQVDPATSGGAGLLVLRSLFAIHQDGLLLRVAGNVLGRTGGAILRTPQDGSWVNFRPLDMIPGIDAALDAATSVLGRITLSAGNAAEAAGGFSEFLAAQISSLSNMAQKLQVLVNTAADALSRLPEAAVLACVGRGTDDVLSQLVSAQNKPGDGPAAYAAGAVILAGGAPSFLIDVFGGGGGGGGGQDLSLPVPPGEPQVP